ncbi:MAG TPA: LysR family transcriptional regulator [Kofleriaceae bacterium]|nr:LysR family transcriptional regulator [Kofleriaceae bacterium]
METIDAFAGLVPFLATAEARSFSQAARTLGVTVSAVSKMVAKLEAELGVRLLHRTSRRVTLTTEGEAFLPLCREAVERARAARNTVATSHRAPRGLLRVSMPLPLGPVVLPALPRLLAPHPGLAVHAIVTDRSVRLADENIDLAIRIGDVADSRLIRWALRTPRHLTAAAPSYLARRGTPARPDELADHALLAFVTPAGRTQPYVFRDRKLAPTGALAADHGESLVAAAIAGAGIVQAMDFMLQPAIARGQLVEILADHAAAGPPMALLCAPGRHSAPRVRAFVTFATELLGRAT